MAGETGRGDSLPADTGESYIQASACREERGQVRSDQVRSPREAGQVTPTYVRSLRRHVRSLWRQAGLL